MVLEEICIFQIYLFCSYVSVMYMYVSDKNHLYWKQE